MSERYCGCCGRIADAGEWCAACSEHIDPRKTFWDATYLARHGVDCPFTGRERRRKGIGLCCMRTAERYTDLHIGDVSPGTIVDCNKCETQILKTSHGAWKNAND